jgi:hypothetical protein
MKASLLNAALAYAAKGIPVFLLAAGTKIPTKGSHSHLDATTNAAVVRARWELRLDGNIGIRTGAESGYIVIDEDTYKGGDVTPLCLPPTLTARTARGGRQYYFKHPGAGYKVPCDTTGQRLGPGIDIKGDGGYAVLPPSRVAGKSYAWVDRTAPADLPPALWPRMVVEADPAKTNGKHPAPAGKSSDSGDRIPEGQRNGKLTSLAGTMRRRGMSEAEIAAALLAGRERRVFIDQTGVGRPIVELVSDAIVAHPEASATNGGSITMRPITFTSGMEYDANTGKMGKAYLVSRLQALSQADPVRVIVPEGHREAAALLRELKDYSLKVSQDGADTYGALKIGQYDDLATALGLAVLEDPNDYEVRWIPFKGWPGW